MAKSNAKPPAGDEAPDIEPPPAAPGAMADARIVPVAGGDEDQRFRREEGMTWSSRRIRPPPDGNPLEQTRKLSLTLHLVTSKEEFDRLDERRRDC